MRSLIFGMSFLVAGCALTPPVIRTPSSADKCTEYEQLAAEDVRRLSQKIAERWNPSLGQAPVEHALTPASDLKTQQIRVKGFPKNARWVKAPENLIFRHYTDGQETVGRIRQSGGLANSFVTYEEVSPILYRKVYEDVTGVFLTLPEVKAGWVGRAETGAYVDVRVPPGTPVLEVEPGRIYVIPLPAQTRPWVAAIYRTYLAKGELSDSYREMCQDIERRGGIAGELLYPMTFVGNSSPK